jgi:hypothetical protein
MAREDEELVDDTVEVYRTTNEMDANRAIVEVLSPEHILAFRRDRFSHALPAPGTETGGYFIAVRKIESEKARSLLEQALADGVIDKDSGSMIE